MPGKKNIRFIINPISGVGKQKTIEKLVPQILDKQKFGYDFVYTEAAGHARELTQTAINENKDIIAIVGGDGSVHEVSEILLHQPQALAIIPTGSGNGIARHFNIPVKIKNAIALLNHHKIVQSDSAFFNDQHFFGFAGAGFDAHIAHVFAKRTQRGLSGYAKAVIREYKRFQPPKINIQQQGKIIYEGNPFILTAANVNQYGNGVMIDPDADTTDGKLSICVMKKIPIQLLPFTLLKSVRGNIHTSDYYQRFSGEEFHISMEKCPEIHLDGEPEININQEIIVRINRKSLNLIISGSK